MRRILFISLAGLLLAAGTTWAAPIKIVAAENFYGDIARQIGGDAVTVDSILSNPDQDPHEFEASASTARKITDAQILIYNGAGYDEWMEKLIKAAPSKKRVAIEVGDLMGKKEGDNPHLWYDVNSVSKAAGALTDALVKADPAHKTDFEARRATLGKTLDALKARVAALRGKFAGQPVTATEPVFGYMADAIGLAMRNGRFQLAVMNDTEPSASDIAAFENDLRGRKVKVLFYNSQAKEPLTERLRKLALDSKVPVVGVTETEPQGQTYQQWMNAQLDALEQALSQ